jgi:hypothetical protein
MEPWGEMAAIKRKMAHGRNNVEIAGKKMSADEGNNVRG